MTCSGSVGNITLDAFLRYSLMVKCANATVPLSELTSTRPPQKLTISFSLSLYSLKSLGYSRGLIPAASRISPTDNGLLAQRVQANIRNALSRWGF